MKRIMLITFCAALNSAAVVAAELKDPYTRDEDISKMEISVDYALRGDGLYEYVYDVVSPGGNLGHLQTFTVDLSCTQTVDGPAPPPATGEGALESLSEDGAHVPTSVETEYGQAAIYGIDASNRASWLLSLDPGESSTGLRLVSPAKPGLREYQLIPFMQNDPSWDYPPDAELDPAIPWIEDFTVTGMIAGPGCPGVSPPVEEPSFAGTNFAPGESEETNALLTYRMPLQDRLHVEPDTDSVVVEIVYSNEIDPKTFKVQPGYLRNLFDPEPGTAQRVHVPLKANKDLIHFEVRTNEPHGPRKNDGDNPSYKDRDVFEIRR